MTIGRLAEGMSCQITIPSKSLRGSNRQGQGRRRDTMRRDILGYVTTTNDHSQQADPRKALSTAEAVGVVREIFNVTHN